MNSKSINPFHSKYALPPVSLSTNISQAIADAKQQTAKYKPIKTTTTDSPTTSIQAKLVLLTLTFPRLRIIWSSSPYATVQIFQDLKLNQSEPDPKKAILIGSDDDPANGSDAHVEGINTAAEDVLRTFPGITSKNIRYVMRQVESIKKLCDMSLLDVQEMLGNVPGKACYEFLHRKR